MNARSRLPARPVAVLLAAIAMASPDANAQVPPHAVLLNPSGAPLEPRLVRAGETVHAVGSSATTGGFQFIHYARSDDGGRTWPVRELPIGYANALGGLAAEGDLAVVLIHSLWLGPHTITSWDRGVTWWPPVRVCQQNVPMPGSQLTDGARFHVAGTTINVVWFEPRGVGAMWTNRSVDGGLNWQPVDTQLDTGVPLALAGRTSGLRVFGDGGVLHAIWGHQTANTAYSTWHQRSFDGGLTWRAAPRFVMNVAPLLAVGNATTLHVVDANISATLRSTDAGDTWSPVTTIGFVPRSLAVEGSRVLAVASAGQFPTVTILLQMSVDDGATWLPQPYTIAQIRDVQPEAFVVGGTAFVRIRYPNSFPAPVPPGFVIQSDDGVQWRVVDSGPWHGVWPSADGCIATTRTSSSSTDVHAYVVEGHTSFGQGTVGTGGFVPLLRGTGLPGLGRTFALDVDGGRGGSLGAWFATFGATANVPLGSATLYLQQPIGPFGFLTSGTVGAAGAGAASLPIAVPASTAFAGLRLLSQAFVFDSGSPDGFAATRAMETWIR